MDTLILSIENITNETLNNIEILNAVQRFDNLDDQYGVKISYFMPNITYKDFIMNLFSYYYKINMIRLSFIGKNINEFKKIIMFLSVRDIKGSCITMPFAPYIYSKLCKSVSDNKIEFVLDCMTKFTFYRIPANSKINIYFYIESSNSNPLYLDSDPKIYESLSNDIKETIQKMVEGKTY